MPEQADRLQQPRGFCASAAERTCTTNGSSGASTNAARVANEPPSSATLIAPGTWPPTKSSTGRASSTVASPGSGEQRRAAARARDPRDRGSAPRSARSSAGAASSARRLRRRSAPRPREAAIRLLLAADRRRVLVAHVRPAERPRDVAGIDDRARRAARRVGAASARGRPRPRAPRWRGRDGPPRRRTSSRPSARARSADDEGAVLGPVARRVPHDDLDRADPDRLPVLEWVERILGPRERVDRDRDAVLEREAAVAGEVVGVGMRLEHAHDANAGLRRRREVRLDRECRVDDDRFPGSVSPTRYEPQPRSSSTNWRKSIPAP